MARRTTVVRVLRRDPPRCDCGVPLTPRTLGEYRDECRACSLDRLLADPSVDHDAPLDLAREGR